MVIYFVIGPVTFLKEALASHYKIPFEDKQGCGQSKIVLKHVSDNLKQIEIRLKNLNAISSNNESEHSSQEDGRNKRLVKLPQKLREIQENDYSDDDDDDTPRPPTPPKAPKIKMNLVNSSIRQSSSNESVATATNSQRFVRQMDPSNSQQQKNNHYFSQESIENGTTMPLAIDNSLIKKNSALLVQILKDNQELKHQVAHLTALVQSLVAEKEVEVTSIKWEALSSAEKVEEFNENLNDRTFMEKMEKVFQIVGGKDTTDTVRRILSKLMKHQCALLFNWTGQNGKYPFSKCLKVLELILVSTRNNSLSKAATQKEVEDVIKKWLRNSSDREGGRGIRKKG